MPRSSFSAFYQPLKSSVSYGLSLLSLSLLASCYALQAAPEATKASRLACVVQRNNTSYIYTLNPDGSDLRLLSHKATDSYESGLPQQLRWSPTSQKLLFTNHWGGNGNITLIDADGRNLTELTQNQDNDSEAQWSPDGKFIAYTNNPPGETPYRIMIMDQHGKNARILAQQSWNPVWSPAGQQIAFVSGEGLSQIYVIQPDGQKLKRISDTAYSHIEPEWSPNGQQLAYTRCEDDICQIRLHDLASSEDRVLVADGLMHYGSRWSPDGKEILFVSVQGDSAWIEAIRPDGSQRRELYREPGLNFAPEWSPDSQRVIFQRAPATALTQVHLVNIRRDGTNPIKLQLSDQQGSPLQTFWPSWSR